MSGSRWYVISKDTKRGRRRLWNSGPNSVSVEMRIEHSWVRTNSDIWNGFLGEPRYGKVMATALLEDAQYHVYRKQALQCDMRELSPRRMVWRFIPYPSGRQRLGDEWRARQRLSALARSQRRTSTRAASKEIAAPCGRFSKAWCTVPEKWNSIAFQRWKRSTSSVSTSWVACSSELLGRWNWKSQMERGCAAARCSHSLMRGICLNLGGLMSSDCQRSPMERAN